ncbi:MAG TPA: uroporphyrinogen-III C-methyltransferase, partial [Burkholderiaceae bacterium]|nr:uroporphyrinogen-III C-methyltransferase [Burkholderiaceae bacterium]
PVPLAPPVPEPRPERSAGGGLLNSAALVLGGAALAASVALWQRAESIGQEAARRLQAGDARVTQLEGQLKLTQDQSRDLQARSGVLESKLTEALGQQAQLERMYRDIAQDTLDAVLADVENSVAIASQQLVVSGNVQGALAALADADGRLARIRQPQAIGMRRLLQRDIDRLKALPSVDLVGLALRLDAVTSAIEQLPLVAVVTPVVDGGAAPRTSVARSGGFSLEGLASSGRRGLDALLAELSQLFRVNRVDAPDALLLAPDQQYFVRENLRLQLMSARIALLSRLEPVFRSDLERAATWLGSYYDRSQRPVANAVATLRQLQGARISVELPSLGDTLSAVRAARNAREGGQ